MNELTTPEAAPEPTEDQALDAVWSRYEGAAEPAQPADVPEQVQEGPARGPDGKFVSTKEPDAPEQPGEDAAEEAAKAAAAEEKPAEEAKPEEEAPGSLPRAIRDAWKTLTPEVRDAFKASQDKMARELGQANRERQAVRPIYDQVLKAAQEFPQLANMTPAQIAGEVFELARWANALGTDPVSAIASLAQERGLTDALKAKLGGEQPAEAASLRQEIAALKREMARMADPRALEENISQRLNEERVTSEVETFARSKADWAEVEPMMPHFVQVARQMHPEAAPVAVLEHAYDMATHAIPSLRERHEQAQQKTRAAEAAKSINVRSAPTKPAVLTDDQALEAVWTKHFG